MIFQFGLILVVFRQLIDECFIATIITRNTFRAYNKYMLNLRLSLLTTIRLRTCSGLHWRSHPHFSNRQHNYSCMLYQSLYFSHEIFTITITC